MPLETAKEQGKKIYQATRVDLFIASFSGGKDSQVVLDLCTRAIPPSEFQVIYSDTGYELPSSLELYEQVKKHYHNLFPSLRFSITRNHESVLSYWDKIGTPSDTHRWCCSVMKTAPLYRTLKIEGTNKQAKVLTFDGVRAEESTRRSNYNRVGKGKHTTIYNAHPIILWNTVEIFLYSFKHDLIINKAYRQGKSRVGCIICPFSTPWDDMISHKNFHAEMKPFVDRLKLWASQNKINDIDDYLKKRNWKIKAIGNKKLTDAKILFQAQQANFIAIVKDSNYNVFAWLPTLGEYTKFVDTGITTKGEIKFDHNTYSYEIQYENGGKDYKFILYDCLDTKLIYLLKRIINKCTYCIQCEVCEVDCPTGALTVYPTLNIDRNKCIHCHRCLMSHSMGCIAADSIRMIKDMDKKSTAKVHAYKKFGMRDIWIDELASNTTNFWSGNTLGTAQVDSFKGWLKDAEVIDSKNQLTVFGEILLAIYREKPDIAWELLWVNLTKNSYIANWFVRNIPVNTVYDRYSLNDLIGNIDTGASKTTNENAIIALMDLFKNSPIGTNLRLAVDVNDKQKARRECEEVSDMAVAYCLYKYTEDTDIQLLRVQDFYSEGGLIGPNAVFGIGENTFKRILRQLSSQTERVLIAELNMGLDNISLRDDLSALDIIKTTGI